MMSQKKLLFLISSAILVSMVLLGNLSPVFAAWSGSTPATLPVWAIPVIILASVGGLAAVILVWYFQGRKTNRDATTQVPVVTE